MNLGPELRKRRKEKGLTLKTVAEKAGISEGFLSQVENDVNSPSVETLIRICNAIGADAGDVIRQAEKQDRIVVVRKAEWEDAELPPSGFSTRRFMAPENRKVIDSSILALEPGTTLPARKNIRNSQEVLTVLKGSVELRYGDEIILLFEGDSVHYWALPDKEQITNRSKGLSVVLWVGTL